MAYLVISASLNPASRSRLLALRAQSLLAEQGVSAEYIDLMATDLPACDGDGCYSHPVVREIAEHISHAQGIVLATPIYNFSASASAKNLVELTGAAWSRKVVGFLCAAGGPNSYMAVMGLANTLMLDFRSIILPRFVYAAETAFEGEDITDPAIVDRLRDLASSLVQFSTALRTAGLATG